MAQHDYTVDNAAGAAVRADLNNAFAAIVTNNSGAAAPSPTFAFQWWADTSVSPALVKQRNAANTAWITVGRADTATLGLADRDTRNVYTKAQDVAQVTLTDAATINTDASLSNTFLVTLGGNRTLANPTNLQAGQTVVWHVRQDATGGRTLSFGALFKFVGMLTPTLSTAANAKDVLECSYDGVEFLCTLRKPSGQLASGVIVPFGRSGAMLATPELLVGPNLSGPQMNVWFTVDSATLAAAKASVAILRVYLWKAITANDTSVALRQTGSGAANGYGTMVCRIPDIDLVASQFSFPSCTTMVGLDSNSDFDFFYSDPSADGLGWEASIYLIGYYY